MKQQSGFTLIELIMVIVILGILAATALPKFVNLSADADQAATSGVAGALGSAAVINYATRKLTATNGFAIAKCPDVTSAMDAWPTAGYAVTPATTAIAAGATASCTVTGGSSKTATFVAFGIT